jgi:hypothetical protein
MNPEFQRNLWLEASSRRLAWLGLVLAVIYAAVAYASQSHVEGPGPSLAIAGLTVFGVCALIWGGRAAAGSVLGEVADRTWDFQRLSALTPWTMTWGKLFGATSLAWCAALSGLVIHAISAPPQSLGWNLLFMLGLALMFQALSLAAALIGVRKARAEGRAARAGGVLGGIILGLILLSGLAGTAGFQHGAGLSNAGWLLKSGGFASWWGLDVPAETFRALSMAAFAAFSLAAAWRLMRLELQMRNNPVVWGAFLLFVVVWIAGFPGPEGPGSSVVSAALAMGLAAYAAAFAEPADRLKLRAFTGLVRRGDIRAAAGVAPASVLPFLFALFLTLLAAASPGGGDAGGRTAALLAFIFRDLGVIVFFRFGPRPQRGDFGALIALFVLYGAGSVIGAGMDWSDGKALFQPLGGSALVAIVSGLVQGVIAWVLAARRVQAPENLVSALPSGPASALGS